MEKKMRFLEIDPRKEYKKTIQKEHDDGLLDFIFDHRLFPRRIYLPSNTSEFTNDSFAFWHHDHKRLIRTLYLPPQVSQTEGYLFTLFNQVQKVMLLQSRSISSADKMMPYLFGTGLELKNQDQIFEETGELIVEEYVRDAHIRVEKTLSRLYPEEKCCYLGFQGITIKNEAYHLLLQVGFAARIRFTVSNTLPDLSKVIVKEEKSLIYPVLDDLLRRMLFVPYYIYLN